MSDEQSDARWIITHLTNQTQPCLRCGHPTAQRAVLVTETGQPCLAQPLCRGGCTGPHHRAEHEPDTDHQQGTGESEPGQPAKA